MFNGKDMIILLIHGLIKKTSILNKKKDVNLIKMSQYFPKPYKSFKGNVTVELHLSNCTTKAKLKKQKELIFH